MDLKDIQSVKIYQAVKFDNKLSTFFVTEDTAQHRATEVEIVPHVGVSVRNERDHIIVPYPNIAGIYMKTKYKTDARKSRQEDLQKPAKAQKVSKIKIDPKLSR